MNKYYNFLYEYVDITTEALDLAFGLMGYSKETAEQILGWATGYEDFQQFAEEMGIDFDFE